MKKIALLLTTLLITTGILVGCGGGGKSIPDNNDNGNNNAIKKLTIKCEAKQGSILVNGEAYNGMEGNSREDSKVVEYTLEAQASKDYQFDYWKINDQEDRSKGIKFTLKVDRNYDVEAVFKKINDDGEQNNKTYKLTINQEIIENSWGIKPTTGSVVLTIGERKYENIFEKNNHFTIDIPAKKYFNISFSYTNCDLEVTNDINDSLFKKIVKSGSGSFNGGMTITQNITINIKFKQPKTP